jgi:tetratricopeptide (TPR) repeat protein
VVLLLVLHSQGKVYAQGRIDFPLASAISGDAREHFLQGISRLHAFDWAQARSLFQQTQSQAPQFALAYWGEALTYNPPLGEDLDLHSPNAVLAKLAPTTETRLAMVTGELETGLLKALEDFLNTPGGLRERRQAFLDQLARVYRIHPSEPEVQAFYALALLSVAAQSDGPSRQQLHQEAGQVALQLFNQHPGHVGGAQYTVLAHDEPGQLNLALAAATQLRELESPSAHLRHVAARPSVHQGQWYDTAEANEIAFFSARGSWQPGMPLDVLLETLEWGQYADLQLADYQQAQEWLERVLELVDLNPGLVSAQRTLGRMQARYAVESQTWLPFEDTLQGSPPELLAVGLGAIVIHDLELARNANQLLKAEADKFPHDGLLRLTQLTLEGGLQYASGQEIESRRVFEEARAQLSIQGPDYGLPQPIKPTLELYGETLLRSGKPVQAADIFREALLRAPQRPESLLGLARSYTAMGDPFKANSHYQRILDTWGERKLLASSEAKTHLSVYGEPSPAIDPAATSRP